MLRLLKQLRKTLKMRMMMGLVHIQEMENLAYD